ncbi:MAG: hypothetical protein JXR88_08810 [Clostridia bacterium]|nr:hypothetical protein [Clostridia bacterium]
MEYKSSKLQHLTPKSDIDISVYQETLDHVFKSENLKNVAITGSYSAGKSSVLESYKSKHREINFIHISLAHFKVNENFEENINGDNQSKCKSKENNLSNETRLEGKILNQLIHQIEPQKISSTHFKIKRDINKMNVIARLFLMFIPFLTFCYYKFSDALFNLLEGLSEANSETTIVEFFESAYLQTSLIILSFVCILVLCFQLLVNMSSKKMFRKLSIVSSEIELFEETEDSYFDKHLNEVLYIFKNSGADVIVFEDIDRFENNQIFERLREINYLVNKKNGCLIRFFYLIKDEIFETKDRTKFFDLIMPIVPILDGSNSYDMLLSLVTDKELSFNLKTKFLQGLSLYIDDMRLLKNIYNEFLVYLHRIQSIDLDLNKLFAIITYKNIFPKDFSELQLGRGYVYNVLSAKENVLKDIKSKFALKEQLLKKEINQIENEKFESIEEIESTYVTLGSKPIRINSKYDNGFESRVEFIKAIKANNYNVEATDYRGNSQSINVKSEFDKLDQIPAFVSAKKRVTSKYDNSIQSKYNELNEMRSKLKKISGMTVSEIILEENTSSFFEGDHVKKILEESKINDNEYYLLIKYLIRNGYLDESYQDYLSYFYPNSISRTDKIFLRSVFDNNPKGFSFKLEKLERVHNRISENDFRSGAILNLELYTYLIEKESKYLTKAFSTDVFTSNSDFIWELYLRNSRKEVFYNVLAGVTLAECRSVFEELNWTKDSMLSFVKDGLCLNVPPFITLLQQDVEIKQLISNTGDFLDFKIENEKSFIENIIHVNVKFRKLDPGRLSKHNLTIIYENDIYELNLDNITLFIKMVYRDTNFNDLTKITTDIFSKPEEKLAKYVFYYFDMYLSTLLNSSDVLFRDDESIMLMICNSDVKTNLIEEYLDRSEKLITDLKLIKAHETKTKVIERKKAVLSFRNLEDYLMNVEYEIDDFCIDWINGICLDYFTPTMLETVSNVTDIKNLYDALVQDVRINDNRYNLLVKEMDLSYDDFTYDSLGNEKMQILINNGLIDFNVGNLLFIRENYSKQIFAFIDQYTEEYLELCTNNDAPDYSESEIKHILKNKRVHYRRKIELLKMSEVIVPISFAGSSNELYKAILEYSFDRNDIERILSKYNNADHSVKKVILEVISTNLEYIIENRIFISYDVINSLFVQYDIPIKTLKLLFSISLKNFSRFQTVNLMKAVGLDDLISIFDGKWPEVEVTDENCEILKSLKRRGWIVKYVEDERTVNMYSVHGRRRNKQSKE